VGVVNVSLLMLYIRVINRAVCCKFTESIYVDTVQKCDK